MIRLAYFHASRRFITIPKSQVQGFSIRHITHTPTPKFSLRCAVLQPRIDQRLLHSASGMAALQRQSDWSAAQYLKFGNERTRAVYDLVSQIRPHVHSSNPRIYDLGCGPGNSTQVLFEAFPGANVTGMDSSPDMLQRARQTLQNVEFVHGDLATFEPREADLLFSNAVFHWLRSGARIATLRRLFMGLRSGGVLAIQVPDNYHAPSHALMREVAAMDDAPWYTYFVDTQIGSLDDVSRPDLDPIESPVDFYNALIPSAQSVNIWRTEYHHVLSDAQEIAEWVKGTGLQPYLHRIHDEETKNAFLEEYKERLAEAYPQLADGRVLLGYPRLFVVAVRM